METPTVGAVLQFTPMGFSIYFKVKVKERTTLNSGLKEPALASKSHENESCGGICNESILKD